MSPLSSNLRWAGLALLLAATTANAQPRTAIPWMIDRLGDQASPAAVEPFPEPQFDAVPTVSEDAASETELLDQQLHDAAIGVAELPSIAMGSYGPEIWPEAGTEQLRDLLIAAAPTGIYAADHLLREILLAPMPPDLGVQHNQNRVAALLNIGAVSEAYVVARSLQQSNAHALALLVQAGLLLRNGREACELAKSTTDVEPSGLAGVFCVALGGDRDRADLLLQFALDRGEANQLEAGLLDAIITPELAPPDVSEVDGELTDFTVGFMLHLEQPLPRDYPDRARLSQLWQYAEPEQPLAQRLVALEHLEQAGLTTTKTLAETYAAVPDSATEDQKLWMRMLTAMQNSTNSATTAKLIEAALRLGRLQGREGAAARLIAPTARDAFPSERTLEWARILQRTFLLAGDPDSALVWVPIPPNPDEVQLFAVALPEPPNPLDRDTAAQLAADFGTGDLAADYRLAALAAFDQASVPPPLQERLPAALTDSLTSARGATAALIALSALAHSTMTPELLHTVLVGLRTAGFEASARQIAIEVLLLAT